MSSRQHDLEEDGIRSSNSPGEVDSFAENDPDLNATEQPFKDFSSISEHSSIKTTIPRYYKPSNGSSPIKNSENAFETEQDATNDTQDPDVSEEILSDIDDVPSISTPTDYRSFSFNNDASPLLIKSIDQRFQTRLSSLSSIRSAASSINSVTPSFTNSRFHQPQIPNLDEALFGDDKSPWETIRWSKLRKISNQIFSENAQGLYGKPTCILAAAHIVVGTSHGYVLAFDYHQNLQAVLGLNTKAIECGKITSLAVSADFSYIASGYSSGHIFTWDLAKPTSPNIHIRPLLKSVMSKMKHPDGHVEGSAIIHLSFIGKRHSALVSGDVNGMSFSHDTVRSMVGRTVHTRRILGRYPNSLSPGNKKPTTLLACSPLPLGSNFQPTDNSCLVAIMTPYLLAIVSVLPKPQTEFKTGRPKTVDYSMGLSGAVAWLPALKSTGLAAETNPRLAYSWSNVLTIMEVVASGTGSSSPNKKNLSLQFNFQKRYVGDEPIVSIQWISRDAIALITSTQQLLLLNESTLTVAATVDLLDKHVMHTDYFSNILSDLTFVDPETQQVLPIVVCDAYFNSVKGFKGKLFLLGSYELVVGSVSNWADRLLDTMEMGDYIGAIDLATNYYLGSSDLAIVGLPTDDEERHAIVIKNLPEMILASMRYTFNNTPSDKVLQDLCDTCLHSWMAIGKPNDLLEEIFEIFHKNEYSLLFFECLTPLISNGQISYLPPEVFRELVKTHVATPELANRLEEVICSLDIQTLDLDTAITLAKENHLKDTLIYIWNHALNDYITPLVEFIETITFQKHDDSLTEAEKVYPYISYILSGRVYPTGLPFSDSFVANQARSYIYYFIFSSTNIAWPQGGPVIKTSNDNTKSIDEEPEYPYLQCLLKFNPPAFFAALNEAFEDSFLNDSEDSNNSSLLHSSTPDEALIFGSTVNRQLIINILLEVYTLAPDLTDNYRIFLDIFIARNYPKYSQFIIIPGNLLSQVLDNVCNCPDPELKQECELSAETLLSKYKPYDLERTIRLLTEVKYFNVLQYLFRSEKKYDRLLQTSLQLWKDNKNDTKLLDTLAECLKNTKTTSSPLQVKQRKVIDDLITENFETFLLLNPSRFVKIIAKYTPHLHEKVFDIGSSTNGFNQSQYLYLDNLFKLVSKQGETYPFPPIKFRHVYIELLCEQNTENSRCRLFNIFRTVMTHSHDVELDVIKPYLEKAGAVDSLVLLLRRANKNLEALDSVIKKIWEIENSCTKLIDDDKEDQLKAYEAEMSKYLELGVDICNQRENLPSASLKALISAASYGKNSSSHSKLQTLAEHLWVTLIDALVDISKKDEDAENDATKPKESFPNESLKPLHSQFTRQLLQTALSSLLDKSGSRFDNSAIVRICSALLTPLSTSGETVSRQIGQVRPILSDLFSAYRYQQNVLIVAKKLLDKDAYSQLCELIAVRIRGWRVVATGECDGCGNPIFGLGVDANWLYERWEQKTKRDISNNMQRYADSNDFSSGRNADSNNGFHHNGYLDGKSSKSAKKGKSKSHTRGSNSKSLETAESFGSKPDFKAISKGKVMGEDNDILVVFKCSHVFHLGCLRNLGVKGELKCVIDDKV